MRVFGSSLGLDEASITSEQLSQLVSRLRQRTGKELALGVQLSMNLDANGQPPLLKCRSLDSVAARLRLAP